MKLPRTGLLRRPEYVRDAKLFVIAVEGEKTEAQYFSLFANPRVHVRVLPTEEDGRSSPEHVLERLVRFEEEYQLAGDDERWLVLDVDQRPAHVLSQVCQAAAQKGFQLAISHPCFELWLWLHFGDADPPGDRCKTWEQRLRVHLGSYNKSNLDLSLFTRENTAQAIARARALDADPDARWPAKNGTRVYRLVERLLAHVQPSPR